MLQNARKPDWLKVKISIGEKYQYIKNMVDREQLNTVCAEAKCPNIYKKVTPEFKSTDSYIYYIYVLLYNKIYIYYICIVI